MGNSTLNPTPPLLSGLSWRAIIRDDLMALVKLAEECQRVDGGLAFLNEPDNLGARYFPDAPGTAIGAFTADARMVACSTVHLVRAADTACAVIVGQVQPEWRNQGIGAYLMDWSQVQAQSLFTTAGAAKRLLRVATESLTESAIHRYHASGFDPVFEELVMERDLRLPLPDSLLPAGMSITTWQPALAEQFFEAYEAAFRERPGFPGYSAAQWISDCNENENFKQEWSLLARTGDGFPAGFVVASAEHLGGFVVQVGVIPEQRRRGIASALIVETLRRMQAAGKNGAQLTVNLNNPGAIQTYRVLGFAIAGRRARYERSADR